MLTLSSSVMLISVSAMATYNLVSRFLEAMQIATNLGNLGAQIKVLGPDDYAAYLKNQNQLFSAAIKTLK